MNKTLSLALLLFMAGCSDQADYRRQQEAALRHQEFVEARAQYRATLKDSSLDAIRDKLPLSEDFLRDRPACADTSLNAYPTSAERAAIRKWADLRTAYEAKSDALSAPLPDLTERLAAMDRSYRAMIFSASHAVAQNIQELAEGRITYCQFAAAAKEITEHALIQAAPLRAEIHFELQRDANDLNPFRFQRRQWLGNWGLRAPDPVGP